MRFRFNIFGSYRPYKSRFLKSDRLRKKNLLPREEEDLLLLEEEDRLLLTEEDLLLVEVEDLLLGVLRVLGVLGVLFSSSPLLSSPLLQWLMVGG